MAEDYKRHDISDRMRELLQPHLPGRHASSGRNARDNRQFINAKIQQDLKEREERAEIKELQYA